MYRALGQVDIDYTYNVVAGAQCPSFNQRLNDMEQLFRVITDTDRSAWIQFVNQYDDGKGGWAIAISEGDAVRIASNLVGNADCRNNSGGQKMAEYTFRLAEKYLQPTPQTTPTSTPAPDPRVTTVGPTTTASTTTTGMNPLLAVAFLIGLYGVTRGGRR